LTTVAQVRLWGTLVGGVALADGARAAEFQYDPDFLDREVEVSPITMPLGRRRYSFQGLNAETFHGLPGLLADSLPDRYGNALINAWLAAQGRTPESFNAVERLCYIGARGMGALEFEPARGPTPTPAHDIEIARLVELASQALTEREALVASLADPDEHEQALSDILSIGTSAGGARAKAIVAYNPSTGAVRSGQVDAGPGFEYWILKFDGVSGNKDKELEDPQGYGAIELAFCHMARDVGIEMTESRLLEENGRRHFMTRRFDRPGDHKLHMQSLGALAHYDLNTAGANSYEQALLVIRRLGLGADVAEQQFRRMVFNVIGRNQDDHVKNIAFLMDREGQWSLSPAFDVAYAYQPGGDWTSQHQMSINGKYDDFTMEDFDAVGRVAALPRTRARRVVSDVVDIASQWPQYAAAVGVDDEHIPRVRNGLRLTIPDR
jgi:serine/threonine-protein kinase HipA